MTTVTPPASIRFLDVSDAPLDSPTPWKPFKVTAEQIQAEVARLSESTPSASGRRASLVVHPEASAAGLGFGPAIDVAIEVLLPGETTQAVRRNSGQVCLGISGAGTITVAAREVELGARDVSSVPSMKPYSFHNSGSEPWVWLTYSNTPLLNAIGAAYAENYKVAAAPDAPAGEVSSAFSRHTAPDIVVSPFESRLRGYEFLVDIEVVENEAHLWPWDAVSEHLSSEPGDGKRMIMAMYNPATERRNGANHNFFVTASRIPAGTPFPVSERGHRHNSTAINYHVSGEGYSIVDGERIDWRAGDLLLSAPAWREHAHQPGTSPDDIVIFTVQDHPLHMGMESLIWQEDMNGPILALGSEQGLTGYDGPRKVGS